VDSIFLPLAREALLTSPAWTNAKLIPTVVEAAKRARELIRFTPGRSEVPVNRCFTPRRW
jgi:hypothetical protein